MSVLGRCPIGWTETPFAAVVERRKRTDCAFLQPLSVYLGAGVVPRADRTDNHNRLGGNLDRYLLVEPGDVVFNKLRTWQGGLGVSRYRGVVSPAYFVCTPTGSVEPWFLHYLLRSSRYLAELARLSKFMPPSQFDISWDDLRRLPIRLPEQAMQQRIVDYLDTETARIDALIERKQRLSRLLEQRAAQEIDAAFASEGRSVRLARMASVRTGVTIDAARVSAGTQQVPYLRVANVQHGRLDLGEITQIALPSGPVERWLLRKGDVLMTEGGDQDKLGRGTVWEGEIDPCAHQNHVFAVRCGAALDPYYLAYFLRTSDARSYFEMTAVRSTNLASTSASKAKDLLVPEVSVEQQRSVVSELTSSQARLNSLVAVLLRQVELLKERRQALITAAVTGASW